MTDNEKELLYVVRGHDRFDRAVEIAIKTILEFLVQDESSRERQVACSQELV